MQTAAISTHFIHPDLQTYFRQRFSDLQKLGQALHSTDLAGAREEFKAIYDLGQNGPFANGDAFKVSQRQQDFEAIGHALQTGDLSQARQAFAELKNSFHPPHSNERQPALGLNPSESPSSARSTESGVDVTA